MSSFRPWPSARWCAWQESNLLPLAPRATALQVGPRPRCGEEFAQKVMRESGVCWPPAGSSARHWPTGLGSREIESDSDVGRYLAAAQHTWDRLQALADASQTTPEVGTPCASSTEPVWLKISVIKLPSRPTFVRRQSSRRRLHDDASALRQA